MLTLRLGSEAETLLEEVAAKAGQTKEEYARRAVLDRLEDSEDYEAGVRALRESDVRTAIPFEEVVRSLEMEAKFPPKGSKTAGKSRQSRAKANPSVSRRKTTRVA